MINQKFIVIVLIFLVFTTLSFNVHASDGKAKDVSRKEVPCDDGNCTLPLDIVQEFAKYQVYHTFEVSGNLIHNIIRIKYYHKPPLPICLNVISTEEENLNIFDVSIFKNGEQIAFEPYVEDDKKSPNFPCYSVQSNDTIIVDYYLGGKIKPVTDKVLFFNITRSQFFYPFDKDLLTSWTGLDQVYYNRIDKVILPDSFILIEEESDDICPSAIKWGMYRRRLNLTTNETSETLMANFYRFGELLVFEGGGKGDFLQSDNQRIYIWPTLSSSPLKWVKNINPGRYNFSVDEWDNIYDRRTGCYLTVKYERTPIIKYFFSVALILISLSSIYFLWSNKDEWKLKLYKIFSSAFIIWSFQEGISSLTPLVRPTTITLFDLTLFVPIIFILLFYRRPIFYKPIGTAVSFLRKFLHMLSCVFLYIIGATISFLRKVISKMNKNKLK